MTTTHPSAMVGLHMEVGMVNVFINGSEFDIDADHVSYDKIVELAGRVEPNITFTTPDGRDGSMRKGSSTAIADGMIFHAINTNNA